MLLNLEVEGDTIAEEIILFGDDSAIDDRGGRGKGFDDGGGKDTGAADFEKLLAAAKNRAKARGVVRPQGQASVCAAAISPVRKRSSGRPSTPRGVITTSPIWPEGRGAALSSRISTMARAGLRWPPVQ